MRANACLTPFTSVLIHFTCMMIWEKFDSSWPARLVFLSLFLSTGDNWFYKYDLKTPCPWFIQKKKRKKNHSHITGVLEMMNRRCKNIFFLNISMASFHQLLWSERHCARLRSWNSFIITDPEHNWHCSGKKKRHRTVSTVCGHMTIIQYMSRVLKPHPPPWDIAGCLQCSDLDWACLPCYSTFHPLFTSLLQMMQKEGNECECEMSDNILTLSLLITAELF